MMGVLKVCYWDCVAAMDVQSLGTICTQVSLERRGSAQSQELEVVYNRLRSSE